MRWNKNWSEQGRKTSRRAPKIWREIGEGVYRQASAEREKRVLQLQYQGSFLQVEEKQCLADLSAAQTRPIHILKMSFTEAMLWLLVSFIFLWAGYELALQTLSLLPGFKEKAHVLAAIFAIGTAVGIEWFYRRLAEVLPEGTLKIWGLYLILLPVLCLLAGTLTMGLLRSEYVAAQNFLDMSESATVEVQGDSPRATNTHGQEVITDFYRTSGRLGALLMFLAALGLELIAALTFHEAISRAFPDWFGLKAQWQLKRIQKRMLNCAAEIEKWNHLPEILREEFMRGALLEEGKIQHKAESKHQKQLSISVSLGIIFFIVTFFSFFVFFARQAFAGDAVFVGIDLSTSSQPDDLKKNNRAITRIIHQLKPGSRLIVTAIQEKSFSAPAILEARIGTTTGIFGERVRSGQRHLAAIWEKRSKTLRADANRTDIFGALFKASVLFDENPGLKPTLIILSDMRVVSRGYNFENISRINLALIQQMETESLIPSLKGAQVWILGVHANEVSDLYWMSLRAFWKEFFRRTGAKLRTFSPNRRWTHE